MNAAIQMNVGKCVGTGSQTLRPSCRDFCFVLLKHREPFDASTKGDTHGSCGYLSAVIERTQNEV